MLVVTQPRTIKKIHEKGFFDYQKRYLSVADNATITLQLKAINKQMHLIITTDAEGKTYFDSYRSTTYTDDGVEADTFNRFIDNAPDAECKIYETPTVDVLGSGRFQKLILGGTGPRTTGSSSGNGIESVLDVGQNLYLVWTNKSGQAKDYGITVEWYEE